MTKTKVIEGELNSINISTIVTDMRKVVGLLAQDLSQNEISQKLNVSSATVSLDLQYLRETAQQHLKEHIETRIPQQYQECDKGQRLVLKKAWEISNNPSRSTQEQLSSLTLISNTYDKLMNISTYSKTLEQAIGLDNKTEREYNRQGGKTKD